MLKLMWNLTLLAYVSGIWFACGYGFVRAMLPRRGRAEAILLAPLVGMCMLGFAGLLELTVFLTPLRPAWNVGLLVATSGALTLLTRRTLRPTVGPSRKQLLALLVVPALTLLAFAALYRRDGFHLLVASQDQLQYCANARHMLEVMHTDSPLDVPVPRQDHFVVEYNTRVAPYLKAYRRGAEVLLATTTALRGTEAEVAFPLTVGAGLLTLGLSLAFVGRCLRLSLVGCVVLQLTFLASFHLVLLHYQGSLAHLLALPLFLTLVAVAPRALRGRAVGRLVLTGLLAGSCLSFYSEPAIVAVIAPLGLLFAWRFWVARSRWPLVLRTACLVGLVVIVSPMGALSLASNTFGNLQIVQGQLTSPPAPPASGASPGPDLFQSPFWGQVATCLGFSSYYDRSAYNNTVAGIVAARPWLGGLGFALLALLALTGLVQRRRVTARLLAPVLLAWICGCVVFAHTQDYLRFFRAVQYALPYLFVGLVLWSFQALRGPGSPAAWLRSPFVWSARAALVIFLLANGFTAVRTFQYTLSHNAFTDSIIPRFGDARSEWSVLREEVRDSRDAPVLIAGFRDTIRPHIVALGIRPAPHFLGDSVIRIWPIGLPTSRPLENPIPLCYMNSRVTEQQYREEIDRQNRQWEEARVEYLRRSIQAVVPPGHGYPQEWEPWRDVFPPRVRKGHPLCDVVYKSEHALVISSSGPLDRDDRGPFRLLNHPGVVSFRDSSPRRVRIALRYEGDAGEVALRIGEEVHTGQFLSPCGQVEIAAIADTSAPIRVEKTSDRTVKLRSVTLRRVK